MAPSPGDGPPTVPCAIAGRWSSYCAVRHPDVSCDAIAERWGSSFAARHPDLPWSSSCAVRDPDVAWVAERGSSDSAVDPDVAWITAGSGSSDSAVRHQKALAWTREKASCLSDSSNVPVRQSVIAFPAAEGLSFPPRLGKRARTMRGSDPEWVMLDCYIRHLSVKDSYCADLSYESTSAGDLIGVGFRARPPPETSRLIFDWFPGGRKNRVHRLGFRRDGLRDTSFRSPVAAKAVAAHQNYMLLCFRLPSKGGVNEEFFIYQSDAAVLKKLGPCGHAVINFDTGNNIGIVCCEEDNQFAVAHLTVTPKEGIDNSGGGNCALWSTCPVTAELCYILSKDGSWRTRCLPIRHGEGEARELFWWRTDAVVAFGDSICWVDYLRGMLFCDVFSPNLELRYVPLPVIPYEGDRHPELGDRGGVFAYRSVCVTQDGAAIKFIDAAANDLWFSGNQFGPSSITSWILSSDLTWIQDGKVEPDQFFGLTSCLGLPRMRPIFPLMDMKYPQIVYFVLNEETCPGTLLVPVNMVTKMLGRPTAYARRSLLSDEDANDRTSCNLFYNEPFLPCRFSK